MFYGWVVVGALIVTTALSIALAGPVMSFFIPVMHAELAIPMVYFGLAMSARQIGFALMSPVFGVCIDRYGARPLLMAVAVLSGLVVYSLSFVTTGWHLVALIGMLGLIGLQGGGGDLYATAVLGKWFLANRGKAMSMAFLGMPLGILLFVPLAEYWISSLGWQTTWQILGAGGGALFLLAALLVKRAPDPLDSSAAADSGEPTAADFSGSHQWTRAQALRSPTFWRLAVAGGILMFTISSVVFFRVPHFLDRGMDPSMAAYALVAEAVVSAVVALPMGYLISRFKIHHLTAVAYSFAAIMLLVTIYADDNFDMFLATCIFGVGAASNIILQNTIWPAYFGARHIGAIRGVSMPITLGFAVLGAPVAGWVNDSTGSFVPIWWATAAAIVVAMGMILITPKPEFESGKAGAG